MIVLNGVKITAKIEPLLAEAHRRWTILEEAQTTIDVAWIGCGMPSRYRPGVEAGIFRRVESRKEMPRVRQYYMFTPAGIEVYREWLKVRAQG